MGKQASLRDVAKEAKVSLATASRVMNHDPNVKRNTFEKVKNAANKLSYVFPELERRPVRATNTFQEKTLVNGRVALLIPDCHGEGFHTNMSLAMCEGIEEYLFDRRIGFDKIHFGENGELPDCIKDKSIDGFIVRGAINPKVIAKRDLDKLSRTPHVMALWRDTSEIVDNVQFDDEILGRNLLNIIRERGCKNLALFSPFQHRSDFSTITYAFLSEAQKYNIEVNQFFDSDQSESHSHEKFTKALLEMENLSQKIDGLFFNGGITTWLELMDQLNLNRSDREIISSNVSPELAKTLLKKGVSASVGDYNQIGKVAAEQLLWRIQNPGAMQRRVMISPKIVSK